MAIVDNDFAGSQVNLIAHASEILLILFENALEC
jgi:hypothetical protein